MKKQTKLTLALAVLAIALLVIAEITHAAMVKTTITGRIGSMRGAPVDGTFFLQLGDPIEISFIYDNEAMHGDYYSLEDGSHQGEWNFTNHDQYNFFSNANVTVSDNLNSQIAGLADHAVPRTIGGMSNIVYEANPESNNIYGRQYGFSFNNWAWLGFYTPPPDAEWTPFVAMIIYTDNFSDPDFDRIHVGVRNGLKYSTSSVPVPGAVWLLGSGLVGFAGVLRRKYCL